MNKLKAMTVFVEIVDNGSLTAAAISMDTSLTSVVRSLATLESYLQVRLINRSTRKISLTEEGRDYYQRSKTILHEVADAEAAVMDKHSEPMGKVTITAPVTFGKLHVGPKINAFLQCYKKMQIDLLLLDRPVDMLGEGIDLALRIGSVGNNNVVARNLGSMRHVLCASPDFIEQHRAISHPHNLNGLDCIELTPLESSSVWLFRAEPKVIKANLKSRLITNQVDVALDACIRGIGCCRFLQYQVSDAVKRGDLKILLTHFEPKPMPVQLLYSPVKLQTQRLRSLIEWLAPKIQQDLTNLGDNRPVNT